MMRIPVLRRAKLAITVVAIAATSAGAVAADNPPGSPPADDLSSSHGDIDRARIAPTEPGKEWWRDVVARFPNCATLTDGCQSCVPSGDRLTCANPGIACTRGEWRCSAEKQPNPTDQTGH